MPIVLRNPGLEDEAAFLQAADRSRDAHHPWVTVPDSHSAYNGYLEKYNSDTNIAMLAANGGGWSAASTSTRSCAAGSVLRI
ncbi:MAG: hypothetical protein R3C45_05200 [Phycisphaerales bacterium]